MKELRERKILVVCLQGIGNTLMTLYVVEKYLKEHPANLSIVTSNNGSHEIALSLFPKKNVFIWDISKGFAKNVMHLGWRLRRSYFDETYLAYPSGRREGLTGLLVKAKKKKVLLDGEGDWKFLRKLYKTKMMKPSKIHDINANLLLFGVPNQGYLHSGKALIEAIKRGYDGFAEQFFTENNLFNNLVVAVHPGARGAGKVWAAEKFILLCKKLQKRFDCGFVIVGGDDEVLLKQSVAKGIGESAVLLNSPSILQAASVLQKCNLFIGNDSAPMHMSAILGVPVFALWGYTDFYRTAPYGAGNVIVRRAYDCSPCYGFTGWFKGDCKYHLRCIKNLELKDVLPIVSHFTDVMLREKRTIRTADIHLLGIDGIDRIYELEHGCAVVELKYETVS